MLRTFSDISVQEWIKIYVQTKKKIFLSHPFSYLILTNSSMFVAH